VTLQWSNGAAYDSIHVYRNGTIVAAVPGYITNYQFNEARGLYHYGVSGKSADCGETAVVTDDIFAGLVSCEASDGFEDGTASLWIKDTLGWGVTPLAKSGSWAFTDSPVGTYKGCPTGASGCHQNAIATFAVPADIYLPNGATLEWDQIVITEACSPEPCDRALVEVSADGGDTWDTLASYDSASDPAWADMVATPDDYRHASLDLSAYKAKRILVRFRLESDANLEFDGWYVDNVAVHGCTPVGIEPGVTAVSFLAPAMPNPLVRGARATFRYGVGARDAGGNVSLELHNVAGRLVRVIESGVKPAGEHSATWNGTDSRGVPVPPGVYYAKFRAGSFEQTTKDVVIG
jgi:hypothetical protein